MGFYILLPWLGEVLSMDKPRESLLRSELVSKKAKKLSALLFIDF